MTLNKFMNEAYYRDYLLIVEEKLSEKIDTKTEVYDVVLDLLNGWLGKAEVSLFDLKWLIENYREETACYIAKKIEKYREPDGGPEKIINLPLTREFPIGHLIEYFLILKKPERLAGYLNSIRIPGVKKYAKEIKEMFDDEKGL